MKQESSYLPKRWVGKLTPDQNLAEAKQNLENIYQSILSKWRSFLSFSGWKQIEKFYAEDLKIRNV